MGEWENNNAERGEGRGEERRGEEGGREGREGKEGRREGRDGGKRGGGGEAEEYSFTATSRNIPKILAPQKDHNTIKK